MTEWWEGLAHRPWGDGQADVLREQENDAREWQEVLDRLEQEENDDDDDETPVAAV